MVFDKKEIKKYLEDLRRWNDEVRRYMGWRI
jgi:hypothetical protein